MSSGTTPGIHALHGQLAGVLVEPHPHPVASAGNGTGGQCCQHVLTEATVDESGPEAVNVGDLRERSTVAEPDDRQVKYVGAQAIGKEVPDCGVTRQRVHAAELGSGHTGRAGDLVGNDF